MLGLQNLVSILVECLLLNKSLYANMYGKKHKTLSECIQYDIDLDNNYDMYGRDTTIIRSDAAWLRLKESSRCWDNHGHGHEENEPSL